MQVCDHCHSERPDEEEFAFIKWPAMDYDQEQWICKGCFKHYTIWRNRDNPKEERDLAFKKLWDRTKQHANSYKFITEDEDGLS